MQIALNCIVKGTLTRKDIITCSIQDKIKKKSQLGLQYSSVVKHLRHMLKL